VNDGGGGVDRERQKETVGNLDSRAGKAEGGRRVGGRTLEELLGAGGNAEVYRAVDAQGREAALKLLKTTKPEREPYRRFAREIGLLQSLEDKAGILPVIDAYLPANPSRRDRPWLAMPIAEPLTDALHGKPLDLVVRAIASIATTLARLHDQAIAHRDIKPSNLYRLHGDWLVGDFGLVAGPDTRGLTLSDRPLGPIHFMPYEMIVNPESADPKPADVYSLAKTLWVLATEQRYPPEGHQRAGTRGFEIADARPHPNAHLLDALIDRATRIHPRERPHMAEFAADMARWLALPPETKSVDVGEIRTLFRAKMEARLAEEDIAAERKELALAAVRRLTELVRPLNRALLDLHPRATIDGPADEFTRNIIRTRDELSNSPDIAFRYQRLSGITVGERWNEYSLKFARTVELTADGLLILHLGIWVGHESLNGMSFHWLPDPWKAPVGSVEAEEDMRTAVAQAGESLREAAAAFTEAVQ
jgi:hypothetical protein